MKDDDFVGMPKTQVNKSIPASNQPFFQETIYQTILNCWLHYLHVDLHTHVKLSFSKLNNSLSGFGE